MSVALNDGAATDEPGAWLLLNALPDDAALIEPVLLGLRVHGLQIRTVETDAETTSLERVLTVWSRRSILDERVVAMAEAALQAERLIPIRIEEVEPPIGFRQAQTYDIVNLTHEAGVHLSRELQPSTHSENEERPVHAVTSRLLLRVVEWVLFVVPTILIYAALCGRLMHGTSDYITFVAGAFLVVDTALTGVPAYLATNDPARAMQKLTHCSRIDLALQSVLALVLALFATSNVFDPNNAWVAILFLSLVGAAALALLARYIVVGLWLAYQTSPHLWRSVAASWLLLLTSAALLYGSMGVVLLNDLWKYALFYYVAFTTAQLMVLDVPGFAPPTHERAARWRRGALGLTVVDLLIQAPLCIVGGYALHATHDQAIGEGILRFAACAGVAMLGRYATLRLWARRALRSAS